MDQELSELRDLQNKIDSAKLKLAELSAKEAFLEEQQTSILKELQDLGTSPENLLTTIQDLRAELNQEVAVIKQQLLKLPLELFL